jgi:hypothetical protein
MGVSFRKEALVAESLRHTKQFPKEVLRPDFPSYRGAGSSAANHRYVPYILQIHRNGPGMLLVGATNRVHPHQSLE